MLAPFNNVAPDHAAPKATNKSRVTAGPGGTIGTQGITPIRISNSSQQLCMQVIIFGGVFCSTAKLRLDQGA